MVCADVISNVLEEQGYKVSAIRMVPSFKTFSEKMAFERHMVLHYTIPDTIGIAFGKTERGGTRIYATWNWTEDGGMEDFSVVAYAGVGEGELCNFIESLPRACSEQRELEIA